MSTPESQPERIRITEEDVATESVQRRVDEMAQAQRVALVRVVGDAPNRRSTAGRAILTLTSGGALGGLLAFLANKVLDAAPVTGDLMAENAVFSNVAFTVSMALFIGAGVALADVVMNRSWAKLGMVAVIAIPTALGAALVIGFIAHWFYSSAISWLYTSTVDQVLSGELPESQAESYVLLRLHPIRGLAWLLVGVSAGIAAGAAARSWKRLGLAALGGALGGFIGGFIFDFIAQSDQSEWIAQAVGIILLGILIGAFAALFEQVGKSRWIEIVSGGLAGKQFILYKDTVSLGSSPSADITLIKDAAIAPVAAMLMVRGNQCMLQAAPGLGGVTVNGAEVQTLPLTDMDVVAIGGTQVRYREKASASRMPGELRS